MIVNLSKNKMFCKANRQRYCIPYLLITDGVGTTQTDHLQKEALITQNSPTSIIRTEDQKALPAYLNLMTYPESGNQSSPCISNPHNAWDISVKPRLS